MEETKMKTKEFLKLLAKSVNKVTGVNYDWDIEDEGDIAGACTTIKTAGGMREMLIWSNGKVVFPIINLADENTVEQFSDENLLTLYEIINDVNIQCSNIAVAIIREDGGISLRGIQVFSCQNEINAFNYSRNQLFNNCVALIRDFIEIVNMKDSRGRKPLVELMSIFEE